MNIILLIFLSFISNLNAPGSQDDLSNASASQDNVREYTLEQCKADCEGFVTQNNLLAASISLQRYFIELYLNYQPFNNSDEFIDEIISKIYKEFELDLYNLLNCDIVRGVFNEDNDALMQILYLLEALDNCTCNPNFLEKLSNDLQQFDNNIKALARNIKQQIEELKESKGSDSIEVIEMREFEQSLLFYLMTKEDRLSYREELVTQIKGMVNLS